MSSPPRRPPPRRSPAPPRRPVASRPLDEREIDAFQAELDRVPAPLEPLDVAMVDGFLCGVLVQPQPVSAGRWLRHLTDVDGRALPASFDPRRLHDLARRRHAELDAAIGGRQWFDPWVFELADADPAAIGVGETEAEDRESDGAAPAAVDAVYPWVAGFATALEVFPALLQQPAPAVTEALALLYRHLAPDDLEDADDLLAEIDTLEPPADLAEAVEGLVRATLLLADVGRPLAPPGRAPPRRPTTRG